VVRTVTAPLPPVGADTAPEECAALLPHDLASFPLRAFRELNPRTLFATNWQVQVVAAVRDRVTRRLIISLPPRHLKSHTASVAFPAWCLDHRPDIQILCVTPGF
jgi:hypothetical protein